MSNDTPSLAILGCLQRISEKLEGSGTQITATSLKKTCGIGHADFDAAVKHGHVKGFLEWYDYNYFSSKKPYRIPEIAYYATVQAALNSLWISDSYGPHEFHIRVTAHDDSKIVGKWTRPDLTLVSHKKFPWTVGSEFDVVTFEVKRPLDVNVLAVFEALSHASAATKAYVVFPIDFADWSKKYAEQAQRIRDECSKHGVGLISINTDLDPPKAKTIISASRKEIDHRKCSEFLDAVMPNDIKGQIATWKN